MSRRQAQAARRRIEWQMHAGNCFIVTSHGLRGAEAWMWFWLLRLAGAPA
jgi:hypothetical protein